MPSIQDWEFWDDEMMAFRVKVTPSAIDAYYAGGVSGAAALPPGLDVLISWDAFNQDAIDWLYDYQSSILYDISQTQRDLVTQMIDSWIKGGAPLNVLENWMTTAVGKNKAHAIATTEITRIYAEGNKAAWNETGIVSDQRWMTAKDDMVCFPAFTLVETSNGLKPIQKIRIGDKVKTRGGYKKVIATRKRDYQGNMTALQSGGIKIIATSDHPVWNLKKGWLNIGKFKTGDSVYFINDSVGNVDRVFNFNVGDPNNMPASFVEKIRFLGVFLGILMPINSVNLKSYAFLGKKKVNTVASHFSLLNILKLKGIKSLANRLFGHCFTPKPSVAGKTTELTVRIPGKNAKFLSTIITNIGKRHVAPLLTNILILYHWLSVKAIVVYDIQVEEKPEFFANGILVHNCPICKGFHNSVVSLDGAWYTGFQPIANPPAHPRCRCWLQPVVSLALVEKQFERILGMGADYHPNFKEIKEFWTYYQIRKQFGQHEITTRIEEY